MTLKKREVPSTDPTIITPKLLLRHGFALTSRPDEKAVYERKFKWHSVFLTFGRDGRVERAGIVDNDGVFFPFKSSMKSNELAVALKIFVE